MTLRSVLTRVPGDRARIVVALLGYVACSVVLFWPVVARVAHSVAFGGNDPILFVWWLRWDAYAVLHGHFPLRTGWLNYPHGVNSMWNTSVLLLGVIMIPVTSLAGPVASYNTLMVLGPALSGWLCFLATRRWVTRWWPAVFAGAVYGFSPYFVAQSSGHLQLTWALFPPLLALLVHEVLVLQRRPWRMLGTLLGLAIAAQFYVGEEMLASSTLLAVLSTAVFVVLRRSKAPGLIRYALRSLTLAAVVAGLLTAPGLYQQFFGLSVIHGPVQRGQLPGSDLLAPLVPTTLQLLHPVSAALALRVDGPNLVEQTGYLGLPLLCLSLTAIVVLGIRRQRAVWLAVPTGFALVFSLGSSLTVGGVHTGLALPWSWLARLPLLDSLIPVRLSLYATLGAAMLVACLLDQWCSTRHHRVLPPLAALTVLASLVPSGPIPARTPPVPTFFTNQRDLRTIPEGVAALVAPYPGPQAPLAMLWQAEANMRFKMPGGYFLGPDSHGVGVFGQAAGPLGAELTEISAGQPGSSRSSAEGCQILQDIRTEQLQEVLIGPMPNQQQAADWVSRFTQDVSVYRDGVWSVSLRAAVRNANGCPDVAVDGASAIGRRS